MVSRPSWRTMVLSPSPSPRERELDDAEDIANAGPLGVSPELPAAKTGLISELKARASNESKTYHGHTPSPSRHNSLPPVYRSPVIQTVPSRPASPSAQPEVVRAYNRARSSEFLSLLELGIKGFASDTPSTRLPAVYQVSDVHDLYPTPVSTAAETPWYTSPPTVKLRRPSGYTSPELRPRICSRGDSQEREAGEEHNVDKEQDHFRTLTRPHVQHAPHARPRLSCHPYPPPAVRAGTDPLIYPAPDVPPLHPMSGATSVCSPCSSIGPSSCKAPRKRADDTQLSVLMNVFERTSYPSTKERDDLARRLGMTSRSVQIWFQNRRRAVKVEQQSMAQRAQAEAGWVQATPAAIRPGYSKGRDSTPVSPPFADGDDEGSPSGVIQRRWAVKRELVSPG